VLLILGAIASVIWDFGGRVALLRLRRRITQVSRRHRDPIEAPAVSAGDIELSTIGRDTERLASVQAVDNQDKDIVDNQPSPRPQTNKVEHPIGIWTGIFIIVGFFISFLIIVIIRGALHRPPVSFKLFSNLYLAGKPCPSHTSF
jgi:hypothetical protein